MISNKYKDIYDKFISNYEEIHLDPWHEINKDELNNIYNYLVNNMNIDDEYSFKYFMDYIIKRLSGTEDAHTKYSSVDPIPFNFRLFDNEVIVNYPEELKGCSLESINGIPIAEIINQLDNVSTYGTVGRRNYEIEKNLFNRTLMFGLPIFSNQDELVYSFKDLEGNIFNQSFKKDEKYNNLFDWNKYMFGNNTEYKFIDNCLVYNHTSVQKRFENKIKNAINELYQQDLSNIDTIIIDLRGNWGGNAALNKYVMDFIKNNQDKKLICLTDYRVFSGGRYALRDLIELGAITIGEEISTPINCFGNSNWINLDGHEFSISECYFHPFMHISAESKEQFKTNIKGLARAPFIFKPDIEVNETKEDYIVGRDTTLNYALEYSKENLLRR